MLVEKNSFGDFYKVNEKEFYSIADGRKLNFETVFKITNLKEKYKEMNSGKIDLGNGSFIENITFDRKIYVRNGDHYDAYLLRFVSESYKLPEGTSEKKKNLNPFLW